MNKTDNPFYAKGVAYQTVKIIKEDMLGEKYVKPRDKYLPQSVSKYLK